MVTVAEAYAELKKITDDGYFQIVIRTINLAAGIRVEFQIWANDKWHNGDTLEEALEEALTDAR